MALLVSVGRTALLAEVGRAATLAVRTYAGGAVGLSHHPRVHLRISLTPALTLCHPNYRDSVGV